MNILEAAKDLVDEGLEMRIGQGLAGADDGSQVTFHQFCKKCQRLFLGSGLVESCL
jgi:hypothetical protein